jgi:glyoxylase-like metal-dependent hydrolase (beta-lactamase superfamily II)
MVAVHAIRSGVIRIRPSLRAGDMRWPVWRRRLAILLDRDWTEPLPIYSYLVEHHEGLLLLDAGESARAARAGWFPIWNPFLRLALDIHVEPEDEVAAQLQARGVHPARDLKSVVLSHLHHDHADGLAGFEGAEIIVSEENYRASQGLRGAALGAVPTRWPAWFDPHRVNLTGPPVPGFATSLPLTTDGAVFAVPTPGHMPGHLSVVVRADQVTYFLAGDATYDETLLKQRVVDGASGDPTAAVSTLESIATFARSEPTVLLPAHDPLAEQRLRDRVSLNDR